MIEGPLQRLDAWLEANLPALSASLRPGVDDATLDAFEACVERVLPPEFRAHLGIDLDPGALGTPGQLINFGGREFDRYVLAPNLAPFVEPIAVSYARGQYDNGLRVVF